MWVPLAVLVKILEVVLFGVATALLAGGLACCPPPPAEPPPPPRANTGADAMETAAIIAASVIDALNICHPLEHDRVSGRNYQLLLRAMFDVGYFPPNAASLGYRVPFIVNCAFDLFTMPFLPLKCASRWQIK